MNETSTRFQKVSFVTVSERSHGQRIDNFLLRELGNTVPRSLVYKILRKGEVRVDKKRARPSRKLVLGEVVRIPPVRIEEKQGSAASSQVLEQVEAAIVLEDEHVVILNKPAGLPVHGGSGYPLGLIEVFRQLRPDLAYIELAHRLDKDTSGIILLAKSRQALQALHALFKSGGIDKRYLTLAAGIWRGGERCIQNELVKTPDQQKKMRVKTRGEQGKGSGKQAESIFTPRQHYPDCTLLEVRLLTGRMHQIRTQLSHLEMPVIGDERYGDFALNRHFKKTAGLKRLFLHAYFIDFVLEFSSRRYHLELPLADDLQGVISKLNK